MARRRYTSTEISIDRKVNKLALEYGDFAALLYTWMIPHTEDNCEIVGDPEELKLIVCPGRKDKTEEDIKHALAGMAELKLIFLFERDGKPMILIPPKSFYKYQTYISHANRDFRGVETRSKQQNAEERRESPQNTVSPSPSLSPSIEEDEEDTRAREAPEAKVFQFFNKNIGPITPFQAEVISQHLDEGTEPDMIIAVMQDSMGKDNRWSWINTVLSNSSAQNVKTLEQYEAKKVERKNAKSRDKPQESTGSSGSQSAMLERVKQKIKGARPP
jgi:DnaD/phage-associated family protein